MPDEVPNKGKIFSLAFFFHGCDFGGMLCFRFKDFAVVAVIVDLVLEFILSICHLLTTRVEDAESRDPFFGCM